MAKKFDSLPVFPETGIKIRKITSFTGMKIVTLLEKLVDIEYKRIGLDKEETTDMK